MQQSIIDNIRNGYIEEYLENSKKREYNKLTATDGLVTVMYKDLPNTEIDGYPFASDFVTPDGKTITVDDYKNLSKEDQEACDLRFYYLPNTHEIYIGSTGCGKTTGCIEPQLRAISSQKNKPNLFITDPKGELFDHNADHLKKQGYQLFVLNFKNLARSDKWNPLWELYDTKMKINNLGKNVKLVFDPIPGDMPKIGDLSAFKKPTDSEYFYICYDGKAFPNKEVFDNYVAFEKDMLEANIDSMLSQFANMMIKVQSNTDKSWEYGAQDLLKGIIQCMLEEAVDPQSGFDKDKMNLRTMQQYYLALKNPILSDETSLKNHRLIKNKSEKVRSLMATALANAPNTMKSYCGVFDGAIKDWFQGHIFSLTTGNTISLNDIDDKPFAIFLITRDYEKSDFLIAGLFIDWVYRQMLQKVEEKKERRPLHFLLDEFGNIPTIRDFENKISTSRSRNIWFHLVLQSYSQLMGNYGQDTAVIIKDNCSQIFLGSTNSKTKETFSEACGKHTIPTLSSRLSTSDNSVTEVPLIPVSMLNLIKPGQIYTLRPGMPVIISQFVRSYICAAQGSFADRLNANGLETCTPSYVEGFTSSKYSFEKLKDKPIKHPFFDDDDF